MTHVRCPTPPSTSHPQHRPQTRRLPNPYHAPENPSKQRARVSYIRAASAVRSSAICSSVHSHRSILARWTPRNSSNSTRYASDPSFPSKKRLISFFFFFFFFFYFFFFFIDIPCS